MKRGRRGVRPGRRPGPRQGRALPWTHPRRGLPPPGPPKNFPLCQQVPVSSARTRLNGSNTWRCGDIFSQAATANDLDGKILALSAQNRHRAAGCLSRAGEFRRRYDQLSDPTVLPFGGPGGDSPRRGWVQGRVRAAPSPGGVRGSAPGEWHDRRASSPRLSSVCPEGGRGA